MTPKERSAIQQALEAIGDCSPNKALVNAAYALREALAEQAKQAEIPEWVDVDDYEEQKQEPVAYVSEIHLSRYTLEWNGQPLPEGTELYAGPNYYLEQMAEEAECVKLSLDKAGVPTADESGKVYSLWGRVCRYAAPVDAKAIRAEALEEAVKVCHDIERKRWEVMRDGGSFVGWTPKDVAAAIAALPVPEIQWRDLTDDEIKQAAWGYVEDSKNLDEQRMLFVRAVIAKFKEANK